MNSFPLIPVLLELLAKSAVLLLLGAAVCSTLARRFSAAQEHALWLAIFATLLALPLTKLVAPRWHLPGSPAAPVVLMARAILPAPMVDAVPGTRGPGP